jgi:hypothetical protein
MKAAVEVYKGIEFVRISSLPDDQKKMIWNSFIGQKIIKILRENELLNDCVQYTDYLDWYQQNRRAGNATTSSHAAELAKEFKFA